MKSTSRSLISPEFKGLTGDYLRVLGRHKTHQLAKLLRGWLNGLEIVLACRRSLDSGPKDPLIWEQLKGRVALVKQEVYQDLYCCPVGVSPDETLASSLHRSGPVGLLTGMDADFWIVKLEPDDECNIWREKVFDCHQASEDFYLDLRSEVFRHGEYGHTLPQGGFAVPSDRIDWGKYRVVISYDAAIPARVTCQYPEVTWCYYIGEPCMRTYKSSLLHPVRGYDLFLNQRFRRIRLFPRVPRHVVEFPYLIQYYGCLAEALGNATSETERRGVFVEGRSRAIMTESEIDALRQFGPVRCPSGSLMAVLQELMMSKYFLILDGRKWGNAMIEAVAAGCLVIGNPVAQHHVSLFTARTWCHSFHDVLARLVWFEQTPGAFEKELAHQRRRLDWLCFARPLRDLILKSGMVQRNRIRRLREAK